MTQIVSQLKQSPLPYEEASSLLSRAKIHLLHLNALTPTPTTPAHLLPLARSLYEQGALASIRARDAAAFSRYVQHLQPFYELPPSVLAPETAERNKVTGLYLLLLLTQGKYGAFHTELESLASREGGSDEADKYLGYPIRLERWLMEGSYDRVWNAMQSREVPCDEYSVFSEVCLPPAKRTPVRVPGEHRLLIMHSFMQILTSQIRSEIASSSERAYPSLPLSSTKSLLFLESEGAVIDFARERRWVIRDGHIYFPDSEAASEQDSAAQDKDFSRTIIENTLGYARELETIV